MKRTLKQAGYVESIMKDRRPRTLFLGMQNDMSFYVFTELLTQNISICGIILGVDAKPTQSPSNGGMKAPLFEAISELPLINRYMTNSISQAAEEHELPIIYVSGDNIPKIAKTISELKPDIACVACFPIRIPRWIIDSVEHGFLNLHPSLLPNHRGPVPLFWIFRSGMPEAYGVTVHLIDEGLDSGDIVLQQRVEFEPGISGIEADRVCGEAGGSLLARAIRGLHEGSLEPYPQPTGGSYESWPVESDFHLSTTWSANRAFDFMRATAHWQRSYPVEVDGETVELTEALTVSTEPSMARTLPKSDKFVCVEFLHGWLVAKQR
jgi:methionyl-tRNA formyltransferase